MHFDINISRSLPFLLLDKYIFVLLNDGFCSCWYCTQHKRWSTWTESTWDPIRARIFFVDNPSSQVIYYPSKSFQLNSLRVTWFHSFTSPLFLDILINLFYFIFCLLLSIGVLINENILLTN